MKTIALSSSQTIAYHDQGSGPVLLLIHAFPVDSHLWLPQLEALSRSHRVIAPDLPGFGGSAAAAWTIDGAAQIIAGFLDAIAITEPVALGGLSMGGYIAMAFARQFPQRLRALILADTRAEPDDDTAKQARAKMIAMAQEQGSVAIADAMLPKMLSDSRPHQVAEAVRTMIERQPASSIAAALAALRDRPDARPGLKKLEVPTLVLVGEADTITPLAMAQVIAESVTGAKLVTIPGAGHLANCEAPQAFNAAVSEFLSA